MEKQMTTAQAWADFFLWIKAPARWSELSHKQRNRLILADRDSRGVRRRPNGGTPYSLGEGRMEKIFNEYAPGRYRFERHTVVFLSDGQ